MNIGKPKNKQYTETLKDDDSIYIRKRSNNKDSYNKSTKKTQSDLNKKL